MANSKPAGGGGGGGGYGGGGYGSGCTPSLLLVRAQCLT